MMSSVNTREINKYVMVSLLVYAVLVTGKESKYTLPRLDVIAINCLVGSERRYFLDVTVSNCDETSETSHWQTS